MTSLELNMFSPSESALLKSLLKNPDDFEKIVSMLNKKATESSLKIQELDNQYRYFIENSIEGIWVIDEMVKTVLVNPSMASILGYRIEEMVGKSLYEFMDEKFVEITKFHIEKRKKGIAEELDTVMLHKSGKIVHLRIKATPIINNEGKYEGTYAFITDITDLKEAEIKIKESEEKYRLLFENMTTGFAYHEVIIDENNKPIDYKYLEANPAFEKLTGITRENLIGKTVTEAIPGTENDPADWIGKFGNVGLSGEPLIVEEYSEAIKKWFRVSGYSPKKGFFAVTFTDITDMKIAEQELKESEDKFRTITEQSFLGIAILQNNFVKYVNKQLADIVGYTVKEISEWGAGGFMNVIHPKDRKMVAEQAKKKQLGESDVVDQYEFRGLKKNGDMIWLELFSKTFNYEGELADFVTIHDITDKKIAEQKLKESEEQFRKITEESLLAICIIQDNLIKYVNQEMANLYGYTMEEMLNWGPSELLKTVAPESLEIVKEQLRKKQAGDSDIITHYQIQIVKKDGELIWVDNISKTMNYKGRPADLVTQIDITERIKAQQELIKLSQLKSELLRRTSHELKTPLVSIKGFSELLLEVYRDKIDDFVISTLNEIKQGCLRLESLIGDILKTAELESGQLLVQKSEEDLSFLVRLCVNEIKGLSKLRNHTINLELPENLITHFEKEQIHQVISNVLSNAVKYTPPGGLITIKSEIKDNQIILMIQDDGIGFTEGEMHRLFQQFGKIERYGQGMDIIPEGSGFGLFISKKIVELHSGDIWVESDGRNKGSTFYISLPII